MLQAHAYGKSLGLHLYVFVMKIAIDIACRMTRGKDYRRGKELALATTYATHLVVLYNERSHLRLEMHLATTREDGLAHVLDDTGQAIGADVGMYINEDVGVGTVLNEDTQDLVAIAALLASGVEFAIAVCPGTSLAKGVVALGIHTLLGTYACKVLLALAHILAPLHHDGTKAKFYQAQGGKQSARTCTHNDDGFRLADIGIINGGEELLLRLLANEGTHGEIDIYGALTCVDTALEHLHGIGLQALLALKVGKYPTLVIGLAGSNAELEFVYHSKMRTPPPALPCMGGSI